MRCLLHHTNVSSPPAGIWWEDEAGGSVRNYYIDGADAERIQGTQVMSQKSTDAKWQDYFDFLEEGMPFVAGWESADVSEAPDVYLRRINKPIQTV